jgi:hypothetical protein
MACAGPQKAWRGRFANATQHSSEGRLLSNRPSLNMHVYSELWVSESASEFIANRKNASWEAAAELTWTLCLE